MILSKVDLEGVVIDVVLRVSATISAVAQVAAFVTVTTMRKQLVVAVEALSTEATLGMTFETRLVLGTRNVVSMLLVPTQILDCKEIVFVGKDFFVAGAEITHLFVVDTLDVTM